MLLIPQRLFQLDSVQTVLTDGHSAILRKQLTKSTLGRQSYIGTAVLTYVQQGVQEIRNYEGEKIQVQAGSFAVLPKGIYTISDLIPDDKGFETMLFFIDDQVLDRFLSKQMVRHQDGVAATVFRKAGHPTLQMFTDALMALYGTQRVNSSELVAIKLLELLHLLNAQDESGDFLSFLANTRVGKPRNLRRFLEANFDKPLKVEDYAYLTGRSLSSFRRDFKQHFGQTPQQWLKDKRLEKAHHLLTETPLSVTETAYEVGYENISYFIKAFKKRYGQTPKQYLLERRAEKLS
jgi:AraC-like DNA-binding protein